MATHAAVAGAERFRVSRSRDLVERAFQAMAAPTRRLSRVETEMFEHLLADVLLVAPIYVCGLARAGTTFLLEALSASTLTVSHRYRDYPGLRCPILWKGFVDRAGASAAPRVERAHQDGVLVSPDSPEAFEEVIWMDFFEGVHDPQRSNVLDARTTNPAFETFYADHIRKLLFAYGGQRYLAKGNYDLARLEFLLKLFPDARFVVALREPVGHVGSLMRQHELFSAGQSKHPRARAHLRRIGHFEFGLDRVPVNYGDDERTASIRNLWAAGDEVRGWARCWAASYDHLADRLAANAALREAVHIVHYDALCDDPEAELTALVSHVGLPIEAAVMARAADVRRPDYYDSRIDAAARRVIEEEAAATMARYEPVGAPASAVASVA